MHPLWNKEFLMQRANAMAMPTPSSKMQSYQPYMKMQKLPVASTEPPQTNVDCSISDGVHPHPESCTKFLRCLGGKLSTVNCRDTFYWHQEKNRCFPQKPDHC